MMQQKKILLAFVVSLVVLIANAWVSYRAITVLIENNRSVMGTYEVLNNLLSLRTALTDGETAQRGFIITGLDQYLSPYRTASQRFEQNLGQLIPLIGRNQVQKRRLDEIRQLSIDKFAEMQQTIELRQKGDQKSALDIISTDRGRSLMVRLRELIRDIEAEERNLLAQRQAEQNAGGRRALLTLGIANVLALFFVALALYFNKLELETRHDAQLSLEAANQELGERVRQRTSELVAKNEELGAQIAERRQAEAKLLQLNEELQRSNRELQDFAFVASHDLQEPLRKIQAFGDLLKIEFRENLGAEGRDFVDRMQNAAKRMDVLISDLLEYSRVSTRAQPFRKTDLGVIAQDVLSDLETRIKKSGGQVSIGPLPELEADPMQMRQLLQNLLANALKFHRPELPPIIRVESSLRENGTNGAASNGKIWELRIADNGIGFEEKYLDRIFTPFQRLHARADYEGTGMGLAVVRKIIERHGGTITARSKPGEGSTFILTLPAEQPGDAVSEGATDA